MKNMHNDTPPRETLGLTFDDLYRDISRDWKDKSQALQERRWQVIDSKRKGGRYAIG